jgi:hypothetical protein
VAPLREAADQAPKHPGTERVRQGGEDAAAHHQGQPAVRRVCGEVVLAEHQAPADLLAYPPTVRLPCQPATHPPLGDAASPRRREQSPLGDGEAALVDVGREDAQADIPSETLRRVVGRHRDRVGLLAGAAARDPDPDLVAGPRDPQRGNEHTGLQPLPVHVGREQHRRRAQGLGCERVELGAHVLETGRVGSSGLDTEHARAATDRVSESARVETPEGRGAGTRELEDVVRQRRGVHGRLAGTGEDRPEAMGERCRREHLVDRRPPHRARRHAWELGLVGVLTEDEAACATNRARPRGAIRPHAAEQDAEEPLSEAGRTGFEQGIDHLRVRVDDRRELELPIAYTEELVGGKHVRRTGLRALPPAEHGDGECSPVTEEQGQVRRVVQTRLQRHEDARGAARERLNHLHDGRECACASPDAHDERWWQHGRGQRHRLTGSDTRRTRLQMSARPSRMGRPSSRHDGTTVCSRSRCPSARGRRHGVACAATPPRAHEPRGLARHIDATAALQLHEDLFRLFHRGKSQGPLGGEGIGLALVRRIVSAFGGSVVASGNDSGGAPFTVWFS